MGLADLTLASLNESGWKVLGSSNDITTCQKCGKPDLKGTVALHHDDHGHVHYGVDCAANTLRGSKKASDKKIIQRQADAISLVKRMMKDGKSAKDIANRVTDRIGYSAEVKKGDDAVRFQVDPSDATAGNGNWDVITIDRQGNVSHQKYRNSTLHG